jgi:5-methyltetrahydropteroyltriglutamate--homocysteine methyltransferase
VPAVEELAAAAVAVTDRLGFARAVLRDRIGISPACGLAGATDAWARSAIGLAQQVAEVLASEPESV